jgi:hypothetical protein
MCNSDLTVFFAEWQFNIGSFCLVRHQGIEGIPSEECTRDRYWKARIVEIRSSKTQGKSNDQVSTLENIACTTHLILFQEHYLRVQWFYSKNDIQQVKPKGVVDLDR